MIYIRDENDYAILKRAEDLLDTTFNWNISDDDYKGWLNENEFEIIDDLCSEVDRLKEQLDDMKEKHEQEIKDYYKRKSPYEIYEVNEGMFH